MTKFDLKMTEKKEKNNNYLLKSTKSQTQDQKEINITNLNEEPGQFDLLLKKDKMEEKQNENISNLNINNELQNQIKKIRIKEEHESRKTRPKYFEDINNSSIVKKEESISEFNTNKKSQGSDYALFKIMNEMGNKNSGSKVKTLESIEKYDPFSSINSQNPNLNSKNNKIEKEDDKNNKIYRIEEENIKTNEYVKSENSDFIQKEKDDDEKTNINKMNIELLFKPNEEDQEEFIKKTRNQIVNDIDNIYINDNLNLVKINNQEIYNFVTEYNNKSKDNLEYDLDYYKLNDKNDKFLKRRNNFISHNYFSYIIKEKDKENYSYEKIKKYRMNYNKNIPKFNFIANSGILNSKILKNKNIKEPKINDIENISSFFYNFCLYYPNDNSNKNPKPKILEINDEEEIIKLITSYRKVFNDGHSFQRCFSFLLFETFLLKNKIGELEHLIYDIKETLKIKYLNLDKTLDILNQIKENCSIDNLMDSYNNSEMNIDEIMITYIEDKINILNKIDTINKRKHQEINYIYLKTLCDIFDINLKILSIEENKSKNKINNNQLLSLNTLNIYCESYDIKNKSNKDLSESNESNELSQNYPTLCLLFFLNSYHIIYTNKSDIDSTLANNELSLQHYLLPSLPNIKCPKCNKNTSLDIIPYYEAVLCHKCLINYMKDIIKSRVESFIKSGFSSVEYFTRPISIKSEIKINLTLYRYITGNYLIKDFENIFKNTCFICYKYIYTFKKKGEKINNINNINNNNNIIKIITLKCKCQICENCLEQKKKEFMGNFNYLNLYELHNLKLTKCPCGSIYDLNEIMNFSKNKFSENDKKLAIERLRLILEKKCCICLHNKEEKIEYINLIVVNSANHLICNNCYQKKIIVNKNNNTKNKKVEIKYENKQDKNGGTNKIYYNDLESSNSSLKESNGNDKKFFCNICFTDHLFSIDTGKKKNKNKLDKSQDKCCGKCIII